MSLLFKVFKMKSYTTGHLPFTLWFDFNHHKSIIFQLKHKKNIFVKSKSEDLLWETNYFQFVLVLVSRKMKIIQRQFFCSSIKIKFFKAYPRLFSCNNTYVILFFMKLCMIQHNRFVEFILIHTLTHT